MHYLIAVLSVAVLGGVQHCKAFEIDLVECKFIEVNPKYINVDTLRTEIAEAPDSAEYDTCMDASFEFLRLMPEDAKASASMVQVSSTGEFIDTGISVADELCLLAQDATLLGPILKPLGVTTDNCPPEPGVYEDECYYPVGAQFPSDFPPATYATLVTISSDEGVILDMQIFVQIS